MSPRATPNDISPPSRVTHWQRPADSTSPWTLNPATSIRYGYPVRRPTLGEVQATRIAELEALTAGLALLDTEARP